MKRAPIEFILAALAALTQWSKIRERLAVIFRERIEGILVKRWQNAVLLLAILASVIFVASFVFPAENQICEYNEHTNNEVCVLYHFGPFVLLTIANILRAYSELLTALSTALLAVITWMLVSLGKDQGNTTRRQLRAYVFSETSVLIDGTDIKPPPHIDRTDQPGIAMTIKNSGQTPASSVVHWSEMQVATIDREWAMNPPAKLDRLSPSIISPQGINNKFMWLNRPLSAQEKLGIQNGTYAIYLYGRIEYVDAFQMPHWSIYRLRYSGSAWPPYGTGGASMTFCQDGNDAD